MSKIDCSKITSVSKIKVEENGRQAIILNQDKDKYIRTKVDGCLIEQKTASDWVISKPKVGDVIIELKGCDVDHAVTQINKTMCYWAEEGLGNGKLAALIVCTRYPRIDTKIQRFKNDIAKRFKAPVHIVTKNYEYDFACLLSFTGPHRT